MNEPRYIEILCASPAIEAALSELGRTEDVKFSPSGRRVALADFSANLIWVCELIHVSENGAERIVITHLSCLESPDLCYPHGLCWLGEERLVVANREGKVQVFGLDCPQGPPAVWRLQLRAEHSLALGLLEGKDSPGSVALRPLGPGRHELIVCHNYVNLLSHHLIGEPESGGLPWYSSPAILLRKGLDIPDGVTLSPDGTWLAISNHGTGEVLIHENSPDLGLDSPPAGVLQGVHYPHGLSFTPDGQALLVADAGLPFLHVFRADAKGWRGARQVSGRIQVVDDEAYQKERVDVAEGGPKGLDMRPDGLLVLTCKARPLVFLRLPGVCEPGINPAAAAMPNLMPEQRLMAFMTRHLKGGLVTAEILQAQREASLTVLKNSLSWRLTAGLRWLGRLYGVTRFSP